MRDGFIWKCLRGRETINVVEGKTVDDGGKEDSVPVVFAGATAQNQAPAPAPTPAPAPADAGSPQAATTDEAVLHMGTHLKAQHDAVRKEIEVSKQQLSMQFPLSRPRVTAPG